MEIVRHHLHATPTPGATIVAVRADRETLAKRRWRASADDGAEFGFDLDHTLVHGDIVFRRDSSFYAIEQMAEPVLEIPLGENVAAAARIAWQMGNLHFPVQITDSVIRIADDIAVRQMLEREQIPFVPAQAVFCPIRGAGHGHHHHHDD